MGSLIMNFFIISVLYSISVSQQVALDHVLSSLSSFEGRIIKVDDADYDYLKLDMNGACVADPALIVRPISDMDVSRAVLAGTRSGLMISVRGGGHSYTCNSVKNGSLQIDMRLMNSISLLEDTG